MEKRYHVNNRRFNDSKFEGRETHRLQKDKSAIFSWRKNTRSNVSLNSKSKKKPDNNIIRIETNDARYKNENILYKELKQIKDLIMAHHPRIFVSPAQ